MTKVFRQLNLVPLSKENVVTHCVPSSVLWLNRISLFIIFFWFGFLKIISLSPAEVLVTHLHKITLAKFISIHDFLIVLGILECIIGILWLIKSLTKVVVIIFTIQMMTTFLPLILLSSETWNNILVLSLSGQYILKNIVLVASAFTVYKDCQVRKWNLK